MRQSRSFFNSSIRDPAWLTSWRLSRSWWILKGTRTILPWCGLWNLDFPLTVDPHHWKLLFVFSVIHSRYQIYCTSSFTRVNLWTFNWTRAKWLFWVHCEFKILEVALYTHHDDHANLHTKYTYVDVHPWQTLYHSASIGREKCQI